MLSVVKAVLAFISLYRFVILFGTLILIIIRLFAKKKKAEKKLVKKEQKIIQKQQKKYRTYKANNALFSNIIKKYRTIIFSGKPGSGKTSLMQLLTRFLIDMFAFTDKKRYRYNKIMNPSYIAQREWLTENQLIPVYTNLDEVTHPITGFKAMTNLDEIFKQRKKANRPCVLQIDEMQDSYGKDLRHEIDSEKDPEKIRDFKGIKRSATKPRHYGFWILGTQQQGEDIVYIFRQTPYCIIEMGETYYELSEKGKEKQKRAIRRQLFSPGWFVSKRRIMFSKTLFFGDKLKVFFKLFLPGRLCNEKQFYINRNLIYDKISKRYTLVKTLFKYEDKWYWVHHSPSQSLQYDHLEYGKEYDEMFNEDGTRKGGK